MTGHDFGHDGVAMTGHARSCLGMTGHRLVMTIHDQSRLMTRHDFS